MPGRPHASITHPPYYHNRQKLPWTLLWQVRLPQHSLSSVQNSELQCYAVVLDLGLIGCLVQYRGCRGPLLIITEPR